MASNRSHLFFNKFVRLQSRKSSGNLFPKMHSYSQDSIVVCCYICLIPLYKLIFKRCFSFYIVEYSHTPLEDGSPYCPVALGFLHLARRGAFLKNPIEAWESRNFSMREGVGDWPLFCQTDTSTQTLKVRSNLPLHLVGRKQCHGNLSYITTLPLIFKHCL